MNKFFNIILFLIICSCDSDYWSANPLENLCANKNIAESVECLRRQPKENILAISEVRDYLQKHKVYISLTTSPERLPKIIWVLKTLDLEHVEKILLTLPEKFKNKEPYGPIPEEIKNFPKLEVIARHQRDLGPATKILYALKLVGKIDKDAIVISIDDDTGLPWGGIGQLIKYAILYPNAVVGGSGRYLKVFGVESDEWPDDPLGYQRPFCGDGRISYCNVLEGYKAIAYKPRLLDAKAIETIENIAGSIKSCLTSDDFVISYVLARHQIARIRISNPYFYQVNQFRYGFDPDALHRIPSKNEYSDGWEPRWSWSGLVGVNDTSKRYQRCAYELKIKQKP